MANHGIKKTSVSKTTINIDADKKNQLVDEKTSWYIVIGGTPPDGTIVVQGEVPENKQHELKIDVTGIEIDKNQA